MKLTTAMRAALELAKRDDGLRRVHNPDLPGKAAWPAHPSTLAALVRHELVRRDRIKNRRRLDVDLWTVTDAGRAALEPPERFRQARPEFLADRRRAAQGEEDHDYTRDPRRRIDDLEVIDPDRLALSWAKRSDESHADAHDRRDHARALSRNARAA